ncbi:hypothetical protein JCM9534A_83220 [Catenuloplanes indicus JCM 9534]
MGLWGVGKPSTCDRVGPAAAVERSRAYLAAADADAGMGCLLGLVRGFGGCPRGVACGGADTSLRAEKFGVKVGECVSLTG